MKEAADEPTQARRKLLVNLGSGPKTQSRLPAMFAGWREFRVDVDPGAVPDLVADITDLSAIKSGTVDAVWSAHCIEHLYLHQVGKALGEAHRILVDDGFLCLIVPDLQAIASYLVNDRLLEIIELQKAVGARLAHFAGTEAALVSSGSAACIAQATAGCIAGTDPDKISRLPDTTGMKNE